LRGIIGSSATNSEEPGSAPIRSRDDTKGEPQACHKRELFPHADMRSYFVRNKALIDEIAFRNSSLQAGYFILAARALELDCGPMSGFDADKLNAAFFPDGKWKVNLLCNLAMETQASSTHAILV
jgi:3-hydroxypropanoate dehydrogenase